MIITTSSSTISEVSPTSMARNGNADRKRQFRQSQERQEEEEEGLTRPSFSLWPLQSSSVHGRERPARARRSVTSCHRYGQKHRHCRHHHRHRHVFAKLLLIVSSLILIIATIIVVETSRTSASMIVLASAFSSSPPSSIKGYVLTSASSSASSSSAAAAAAAARSNGTERRNSGYHQMPSPFVSERIIHGDGGYSRAPTILHHRIHHHQRHQHSHNDQNDDCSSYRETVSRVRGGAAAEAGGEEQVPLTSSTNDDSSDNNNNVTSTSTAAATAASTPVLRQFLQDVSAWVSNPRRRSVAAVLFASFLSLLGFTMAGPLTPALGKHFDLQVGSWFGSLTSAYPLGMLIGISFWPSLSDKIGRRPVLTLSLLGSGIGLLAQALVVLYGGTLPQFLICRVATGLFSGSSPVSKAYLADIGSREVETTTKTITIPSSSSSSSSTTTTKTVTTTLSKLPRYLALKDAASTMAFILGPAIGGLLYDIRRRMVGSHAATMTKSELLTQTGSGSLAFVIAVSAVASIVAAIFTALFVKESNVLMASSSSSSPTATTAPKGTGDDDGKSVKSSALDSSAVNKSSSSEEKDDEMIISCPLGTSLWAGVASVCLVSFLFNVGDSTFHAFYSAFLQQQEKISTGDIGLLFTSLACVSFTVSSTSASALMKRFGPVLTCAGGLSLVGSGLLLLGLIANAVFPGVLRPTFATLAGAAGLYYCGVPVYGPTIPTMLLRCVPSNKRGAILGLDGSINTLARIITPLLMGELYRRSGAGTAFLAAGFAVLSGAAITIIRRYTVSKDLYAK